MEHPSHAFPLDPAFLEAPPEEAPEGPYLLAVVPPGDAAAERLVREAHARLPAPPPLRVLGEAASAERARLMRGAVLVVLPAPSDTAALEALAAGATLVTLPGLPGFARPDDTCRMVPPGRPELFALALAQLLADPYERRRLAENGHAAARDAARMP